ncbi:MAG TPA: HPr(Ser) kinase/phosphatase [Spirochaetota bacterium]|nr:HPr(Ser) kinase/phosphatase [Spirochaetota bacterium]OPZ36577.1 MAG: HPr kinase/phosphorylase [Spirochaetes bacterium ADurb.BinA120]HNU92519.1 HPr(Ser) kinase/phosphatase [Spirochaetota bacterium]HPI14787.1 HPr(Ser) kinase/phosphatase [Spirochaetota bacterium]HPO44496.1 HPr(Ser) kinase/phosphatase [Spirochaetota bacterium]
MQAKKIYVRDLGLADGKIDLQMELVAGKEGLGKEITVGDVNRPGLGLAGFFDFFAYDRIQIFGLGETAFMRRLTAGQKEEVFEKFFSFDVLCCVFTHNEHPDEMFVGFANRYRVPTFVTRHRTTRFISLMTHVVEEFFSPTIVMHGTLVDIYGIGMLLLGKSGVGKSETALELIERGHRLVADDMVEVKKIDESLLMGSGSEIIRHHMEIRGLGIINARDVFGIRSIRNRKRIEMVALLEEWKEDGEYDRLGIDEKRYTILDLEVPFITVPVRPGRNIPVIIETAALNQRLKKMGVFSARELDNRIQNWMRTEGERSND